MCRGQYNEEKNDKTRTLSGPVQKYCTICRKELIIAAYFKKLQRKAPQRNKNEWGEDKKRGRDWR
ncbi:unnamed protein product [Brugia timori]|uniref:Uncharacterized protein n=1 Tax=Brugia timori TaxID=42155 RepID=A0A3P7WE08_9BILA|nr:unnamed protein product [Brugia timori]